jgi:hypothetical protein
MKVLFHFVSGQPMPNYIASKIIQPDKNVFLCTDEVNEQYEKSVPCFDNPQKEKVDAWDYSKIQLQLKEIIDKYSGDTIILNFTAGNKIMSLAGFNLFKDLKKECYYINTEDNELIKFDFVSNKINKEKLNVKCDLKEILRLNAQEVEFSNFKIEKEQKQLVNLLEHDKSLNSKILEIGNKINFKNSFTKQIDDGKLKGSLIKYQNDILVVKFVRDGVILYEHQETGKFLIELLFGKWFEYICFEKLKNLGFFDNIEWGCNIKRKDARPKDVYGDKNEIDIIGNKGIYCYIFECKAGNIKAEAVDKLVAIKETYIGRYSSLFFISKYPLNKNDSAHKNVLEKMNDNKIIHLTYRDLSDEQKLINNFNQRANLR